MSTHITGWKVPAMAWLPISAAIIAETVSNGLRAYGLGTHLEKFTVSYQGSSVSLAGAVLVLAAAAVSLSQARAAWLALMPGPWRQRVPAGFAAVLLLAVSISAMATHILEAERAKVGAETGQNTDYLNAKNAHDGLAGQVAALKRFGDKKDSLPRPREAVQTQIDNLKIDWKIWSRSAKCTDISLEASKDECGKVLPLYEEQGAYASLVLLEPKLKAAEAKLESLPKPVEAATTAEATVVGWWGWLMGVAVVFIATFGAVIWAKPSGDNSTATATKTAGQTDFEGVGTLPSPSMFTAEAPDPPKPRKRSKRAAKKEATIAAIRAQTLAGKKPSFSLVQRRYKLPKATASRWRAEAIKTA